VDFDQEIPMQITKTFQGGDIIIEEGTKGSSAYVILSGAVEVLKKSGDKQVTVATLGEGRVFGEMGLIEDRPRSATIRALSELEVRIINRDQFNDLLRTKPAILIPIIKTLFERLREASNQLAQRSFDPKKDTRKERAFKVTMEGQTAEAKRIFDNQELYLTKFPFLIGRHSPNKDTEVFYHNDLFIEENKPFVVSRNHLAIDNQEGKVWVVDRGSAYGTIVNGKEIGGHTGIFRIPLDRENNQIVIGPATSKFIYLIKVIST
jgi:CRP-like cAMP-binding protein